MFLVVWTDPQFGLYGPDVPFPQIHDWQTLRIKLSRGLCYGFCPAFDVELRGDGTIVYSGRECVAVRGTRIGHVAPAVVRDLVIRFRLAYFFSLRDRYEGFVPDGRRSQISIQFDGKHKSVVDYLGQAAGMPRSVNLLERDVERSSDVWRWVYGTGRTCFGQPVNEYIRRID